MTSLFADDQGKKCLHLLPCCCCILKKKIRVCFAMRTCEVYASTFTMSPCTLMQSIVGAVRSSLQPDVYSMRVSWQQSHAFWNLSTWWRSRWVKKSTVYLDYLSHLLRHVTSVCCSVSRFAQIPVGVYSHDILEYSIEISDKSWGGGWRSKINFFFYIYIYIYFLFKDKVVNVNFMNEALY